MFNANKMWQSAAGTINAYADVITAGAALIGLVTTVVLAIKETPKAERILDDTRATINDIYDRAKDEEWSEKEVREAVNAERIICARNLAVNYAPAFISFVSTGACIVGTNRISRSQKAAVVSALNATNLTFQEYKDHMREVLGEKQYHDIEDTFEKARIEKKMKDDEIVMPREVYHTGFGDKLYSIDTIPGDPSSRIYFRSSPEKVTQAGLDFNSEMLFDGGDNSGVYADYLWYLGIKDAIKYKTAMNYTHFMEGPQDFVEPRLHEYEEHPSFHEHWCHIDFDPSEWLL